MDLGARIVIVGSSGAGKSALAEKLAPIIDGPHVELDAMQHGADWIEPACRRSSHACDRLEERTTSSLISDGEARHQGDDRGTLLSLPGSPP